MERAALRFQVLDLGRGLPFQPSGDASRWRCDEVGDPMGHRGMLSADLSNGNLNIRIELGPALRCPASRDSVR